MIVLPPNHKMKWTPKSIGAVLLTTTVCIVILLMFIRFMMYPPGTILDETRDKMFQLVTFIAGIVSGWVLHGDSATFKDIKQEQADRKAEADKVENEKAETKKQEDKPNG